MTDDRWFEQAEILYEETQRFTQGWIWALILAPAAVMWAIAVQQLLLARPIGVMTASDAAVAVLWFIIGVLVPSLFVILRLRTVVDVIGIAIKFTPFHLQPRRYRFDEIKEIRSRTYRPLLEYGGWGIRLGPSGWAYNVRGNQGIQITLNSGKRVLIGTQRPDDFIAAVEQARR